MTAAALALARGTARLAVRSFVVLRANQLVEVGLLAVRGLLLEHQLEIAFVEFFEELVPGNLLELAVIPLRSGGELET
jgi:hypothetical protein